jgi:plastocyanin
MLEMKKSGRRSPFIFMMAFSLAAVAMPSVTRAQAQVAAIEPSNEIKPAEFRIVSTEFRFSPATVLVAAGQTVTLVLDNSGAETKHGLFVPSLGFRLQAKAGEIARKNILVEKPGN